MTEDNEGLGLIGRMFDRSRQIRFQDEDFQVSVDRFASYLDVCGLAHVTLAAEGSAHKILAMDAAHLAGSTVGAEPSGVGELADNSHTLWVLKAWTSSAYWCATRAFHDPEFVREKLYDNPVDANAIAVWMNRVEVARGATFADEVEGGIRELERRRYERLGRAHFDEEPPR